MLKLRAFTALFAAAVSTRGIATQTSSSNVTIAEILGEIPQCALPCVLAGAESAECSLTNPGLLIDCMCTNITLQYDLSTCIQTGCKFSDQLVAVDLESQICASYPKQSRVNEIMTVSIVTMALASVIIVARCAARFRLTGRLWPDDYMSIVATMFLLGLAGIEVFSADLGFGKHYWDIDVSNATLLLKLFYTGQIFYVIVQVTAKAAILMLYRRVFGQVSPRWFLWTLWGSIVFLFGHGLIYALVLVFQCLPISAVWDRSIEGALCINVNALGYAGAAMSVFEDVFLIILPIPMLRTLQVSGRKRVGVIIMFAAASSATVTSIIRLKYLVNFSTTYDTTYDNVDIVVLSLIELLCTVICGSLPALRPYLGRLIPRITMTWQGTPKGSRTSSRPTGNSTGRSSASYSTTTPDYDKNNGASYTLSPIGPNSPTARWKELDDIPKVPALPKSAVVRSKTKAHIYEPGATGRAGPSSGSVHNSSANDLAIQGNRVYVTYDIKVSSSRSGDTLVGQGARRTVSRIGTGRPMSAIGAPDPKVDGSTVSLPFQGRNNSSTSFSRPRRNVSSLSLDKFGPARRPGSLDSHAHDFLKAPTQQRPIARLSSLERPRPSEVPKK